MKKIGLYTLMFLCIAGTLFAGGEKEIVNGRIMAVETEPVELQVAALKGPTGIGMVKLFAGHPDLGDGVTAGYELLGAPDVMVSRVLSGEADIAALPTNVAVKLYNKGIPYYLGAVVGNGLLYLLSSDGSLNSISDLRGRELYNIGKGATPDFIIRYVLSAAGMDTEKDVAVKFTYSHPELAQLMIAGKVQTAVLPEPFATMVLLKNSDVTIKADVQEGWMAFSPTGKNYPMSVVIIKKDVYARYPGAVDRFLQEYKNSIEWVQESPSEAGRLAEEIGIGIPAGIAAKAIPRLNLTFLPGSEAQPVLEDFLQVFMNFDPAAIGGKLPDRGFYGLK